MEEHGKLFSDGIGCALLLKEFEAAIVSKKRLLCPLLGPLSKSDDNNNPMPLLLFDLDCAVAEHGPRSTVSFGSFALFAT